MSTGTGRMAWMRRQTSRPSSRKHDVEEDHVGRVRGERLDGTRAVEGACHGIPLGLEAQGERLVDDLVVLDDE